MSCSGIVTPPELSVTVPLLSVVPAAAPDVAVMVTPADADCVVSATLVADTVTGFVLGTELGAVKSPLLEIVPTVEPPP